jgi:hypothetical protein
MMGRPSQVVGVFGRRRLPDPDARQRLHVGVETLTVDLVVDLAPEALDRVGGDVGALVHRRWPPFAKAVLGRLALSSARID